VSEIVRFNEDDLENAVEEDGFEEDKTRQATKFEQEDSDDDDDAEMKKNGYKHEDFFNENQAKAEVDEESEEGKSGDCAVLSV
jgi:hypothetical protein